MLTMQRRRWIAWAAICLCSLSGESLIFAAEGVPAERRLPPGTTLFISVPDATEAHNRFMESSLGQLLQDDAFEPIREDLADAWSEFSAQVESELGIPLSDLFNLMHGELAFAVVQPLEKELGAVMFVDFGEHRSTVDTLLEKAREQLEQEAERSVESIEGTEVTIYLFDESDEDGGEGSAAYFLKDDYFVLALAGAGASSGILEEILLRWDGEHEQTFADEEVYSQLMLKCQPDGAGDPQLLWYFSPIDLFHSAMDAMASIPEAMQGPVSPEMIKAYLSMLGVDKFRAMGGTSVTMTEEFDSVSRMFLSIEQPASGVLKVFEFPATNLQPPRWVPATAAGYSTVNWNVDAAYKAARHPLRRGDTLPAVPHRW